MLTKKIFTICCISLALNLLFIPSYNRAMAYTDLPNFGLNAVPAITNPITAGTTGATVGTTATTAGSSIAGTAGIFTQIGETIVTFAKNNLAGIAFSALKISALKVVQLATQKTIGKGGGGGVITDWNNYLYTGPKQIALAQMNSFFNTANRGRASSLNYEGVGNNYNAYLLKQARQSIEGQKFTTNLQSVVTDPQHVFASGNMKGIMSYLEPANNPMGFSMIAQSRYANEVSKITAIAVAEQKDGIKPVKQNGKIIQPATLVASALTQVDQQGERLIMEAKADTAEGYTGAAKQILAGMALSYAARNLNYAAADSKGKAAIQNRNDSYPFSVSYTQNKTTGGQLNIGAGSTIISTNSNTQTQGGANLNNVSSNLTAIGTNTLQTVAKSAIQTACNALPYSAGTKTVNIGGKKYSCTTLLVIP